MQQLKQSLLHLLVPVAAKIIACMYVVLSVYSEMVLKARWGQCWGIAACMYAICCCQGRSDAV